MENFWMNKVKSSKQFDMVFIGDSRCYRGIQPAVFEKELGLTAFNAGLSSGGHNMEIYNHISNNILSEPKGGGGPGSLFYLSLRIRCQRKRAAISISNPCSKHQN